MELKILVPRQIKRGNVKFRGKIINFVFHSDDFVVRYIKSLCQRLGRPTIRYTMTFNNGKMAERDRSHVIGVI